MRKLAILVVALVATAAQAQQPRAEQFRASTAGDLSRVCSASVAGVDRSVQLAFCHGMLAGAWGYFEASVPAADRFVCPPTPGMTRAQVANGFVTWLKDRPQYERDGAIDALFRYAAETYPCKR